MNKELGPYRLLRRIAYGGMGEVYLAELKRDGGFSKTLALKTLLPSLSRHQDLAQRFEQEAACAAVLNHPNIVQVFDHGKAGDISYLTMEFVEGPSLDEVILAMRSESFPSDVVAEIAVQLCRALGHAHERTDLQGHPVGIIHGDVSPSNILLSRDGTVKLADFGLSRIAVDREADGTISGKLSYMSPEQANAQALTPASDIYSLGLVLFELFSGKKAFPQSGSPSQRLERIRKGLHQNLREASEGKIDNGICQIVHKALETNPELRFHTAAQLSRQLTQEIKPCGPELLAEFVSAHSSQDEVSAAAIPEPTQVAQAPLGEQTDTSPQIGKHWLVAMIFLIATGWSAGFGWWIFHTPTHAKPKPPARTMPKAPENLEVKTIVQGGEQDQGKDFPTNTKKEPDHEKGTFHRIFHSSTHTGRKNNDRKKNIAEKTNTTTSSAVQSKHDTCMVIDLPLSTVASLDHVPIGTRKAHIKTRTAHLLKLRPRDKKHPEILIRLQPASGANTWKMTVNSDPWMKITLNRRPFGQTPRTGLLIPATGGRLELAKKDLLMRLVFNPVLDGHK